MSDDYRKGTEAAAQDYPHNRLPSRALGQLAKHGFGLMPGSQARETEFRDGYRDTYRAKSTDAQRTITTQSSTSGNSSMSNSQNHGSHLAYGSQIELLQELQAYLRRFEAGLSKVDMDYRQKVEYLGGMMMREDHAEFIENHLSPAHALIIQLRQLIMEESVPALERVVQHLQDTPHI